MKINKTITTFVKNNVVFSFQGIEYPVLTIDASQNDSKTDALLKVLEKYNAHATFFLCGMWTEKYGEKYIERMNNIGCEIGNHSYSHPHFTAVTSSEIKEQLEKTQRLNKEFSNDAKKYFRFPYGEFGTKELSTVLSMGYNVIQWSRDTCDWESRRVLKSLCTLFRAKAGDIVLLHNNGAASVKILNLYLAICKLLNKNIKFINIIEAKALQDIQNRDKTRTTER